MSAPVFDVVIIGSGPGGYRAAVLAALRGLKCAIIERGDWGGACLNRGCVPKKAWYQTARLLASKEQLRGRGIQGTLAPDLLQAWRNQRRIVETVRANYVDYLGRLGVRAYAGSAQLRAPGEVEIEGRERVRAGNIVVATGSTPVIPSAIALHPDRVLTTDALFDRPPPRGRRVAIVGSGVIGTEMSFILAMLGLDIVWLTQSEPLARSRYSASALKLLRAALTDYGITPRTGSRPVAYAIEGDGVRLSLPDGRAETVDWVLVAAGRAPCTAGIGLDSAGVACDAEGFIEVDGYQRTTAANIYAIGDCANRAMTSNHALAEASVSIADIIAPASARRADAPIPQVVYSALELARVGLSEDEAEAAGREVATGFAGLETSPAALTLGDPRGYARLVVDADSGELLGAEGVGVEAGEWIHVLSAYAGQPDALARMAAMRYNHPSLAEEVLNATETLAARWGLGDQVFGKRRE
jgi:dihydrolipoyl dehydrogenase